MYLIQIDGIVYEKKGGIPFTFVEALEELYGVRGARVLRLDGTVVVDRAGSTSEVVHLPTGRRIARRKTDRAVREWLAWMEERNAQRRAEEQHAALVRRLRTSRAAA